MMIRRRATGALHQDWLAQVETDGPFLSLPVLKDIWPNGMDRLGDTDDRLVAFKEGYTEFERGYDRQQYDAAGEYGEVAQTWIERVLDGLAEWSGLRVDGGGLPADFVVSSPGEAITLRPDGALRNRSDEGGYACLLRRVAPVDSLHDPGVDGWAASEIDRMAALLRVSGVPIGIVTDGRWWGLVWAGDGTTVGSGIVDALTWREERELRDAFLTLIDAPTLRAKNPERRLSRLFERSVLEAEEITEALGVQVRKSVELLVQSFSEARLSAGSRGHEDPLCDDTDEIYQAAVTLMMRVVFLLFAEERGMLPTPELYRSAYGITDLLDDLQIRAEHEGEENLDHTSDVWHRLLAVSGALFGGSNFDEARLPAYGGSLFDPSRYPWLSRTRADGGLRLRVSDRVMLHVLESVQVARVGGQARRISFRDVDVEQIGYIYEGLLGYTCRAVTEEAVLGLHGKEGEEPEIDLATLTDLGEEAADGKDFATRLIAWVKESQPGAKAVTVAKLTKQYDAAVDEREMQRLFRPVVAGDATLLENLVYWSNLIRQDLRGLPYVVPLGGLVVTETASRKNAGAHYTPRSLAEEVVLHALQPLVYEPGPLQTNDENAWRLKSSSAILDLKVADIAAGSGAFLVAAARYLADRLVEAWIDERIADAEGVEAGHLRNRAIREVIAHCLYGADINGMAVEMCKLSLWLVSLDPSKPFSFVDDKVFRGNSLLGVTTLDQLRSLHIAPETKKSKDVNAFVDVDAVLAEATRIRHSLTSTVDDDDPQRSRNGKRRLLEQSQRVTAQLRVIADGIIAAGLRLGGKPGHALDDAYTVLEGALMDAFPVDGSAGDRTKLNRILEVGLTPTVETDYDRWEPLHWIIEAPDVMVEHGGFDAVIGNPPFLGDKKLKGALGDEVREFLVQHVASNVRGGADLVAYFFLRAFGLVQSRSGSLGLIATSTIAQGDTRTVSLGQLVNSGFTIMRSIQSQEWPTKNASLEYAAVWGTRYPLANGVLLSADGVECAAISTLLEPDDGLSADPVRLAENGRGAFIGSYVLGKGFVLSKAEAGELLDRDDLNARVIFPYLNGDDLNSRPDASPSRWVINFFDWPLEEASRFVDPMLRIEKLVRPERQKLNRKANRERWWRYGETRPGLYRAISNKDHVLAITRHSYPVMPLRVSTAAVFSDALVVFDLEAFADLAVLSSSLHLNWSIKYGSALGLTVRYTPSDVFETFPRPSATPRMAEAGEALDVERRRTMNARQLGLTDLYNLINSPIVTQDEDVVRLRKIHAEIDDAVVEAYGWSDLILEHGFHVYRKVERFTVTPALRLELLKRLLEENARRARGPGSAIDDRGLF
ncbi:SAM-dependent DNA methyltransferase [Nocardioides panacis]|uniref:site-specific DNA-methyltransferase (adenine-specific) n=1 Tax=Nocardioides panacis TaxID=2849501 RepID=A0A975Y1C1_9ACTN|nr:DNA methyltransferase [Nocardioides panacis]QWZ09229.1 SAM-dependent DNA methyltransferase [Nocardioides panacis]